MSSKVAIIKCDSYQSAEVEAAIHQSLELLGGIRQFVKPGQKVLIKPNALMGHPPDQAVTTHPSIVGAVVKEVLSAGGIALVGDSPGDVHSNALKVMEETGIKSAVEAAGGKIIIFQQEGIITVDGIKIARAVMEADLVINLPKLKTHGMTLYTGAIKNMFGCVPGFYKTQFHIESPRPIDFARSIANIYRITKPKLNIADGIIGMEGAGPTNGTARKLGVILASSDGVALDAVASFLMGFDPRAIETTAAGYDLNLGELDLDKIELVGSTLSDLVKKDWKHPPNLHWLTNRLPAFIYRAASPILYRLLSITPEIDQGKCVKCLVCVNSCPAKTINYDKTNNTVMIDLKKCISCFCCHELCRYDAVKLNRSWLVKLLDLA